MIKDTVKKLQKLDGLVRECSGDYFHSRPLVTYTVSECGEVFFDLRDLALACAVTGNNLLLSGGTGCGKTHLAKMVMSALFGDKGYNVLQMDASFSLDKIRNIAFKIIKEGGNLDEAVKEAKILRVPGVIVDEYNRAPAEITNIIQGWLQNGTLTFEGGYEVSPGVLIDDKKRYQWKIATVNEGSRYAGARKLDKASRDRLSVEIPLSIFSMTDEDRRKLRSKTSTDVEVYNGDGALDDVVAVMQDVREIPLAGSADEFLLYLQRMSQCVKAPNKTKEEIENFSPEYCKGCHLSKGHNNICGNVERAPSDRSVISLQNLAKSFALLRTVKSGSDAESVSADIEDVIAAAPFVLYNKLDINPGWVDKTGKGSKWQAINTAIKMSYEKFQKFLRDNYEHLSQPKPESLIAIKSYAEKNDAWVADLK